MTKFQTWARGNYRAGDMIDEFWHPEIIAECMVMNEEREAAMREEEKQKKERIKTVVASVEDLEETMKGKIVIYTRFNGTVTKTRALSGLEKQLLADIGKLGDLSELNMGKPLFKEFPELKELEGQIHEWRESVKRYGIPFFGNGMTVIDVRSIPAVEALFDEIDAKLPAAVEKMIGGLNAAAMRCRDALGAKGLGVLFNVAHYDSDQTVRESFGLTRKWMPAFDVPDILKEVDMARWEAERKRSAALWAEVRENGMIMLRKQVSEMTTRLVEAMQPDAEGGKKRFYTSTITGLSDFFETFENRNMAGDKQLAEVVSDLKKLVSGEDVSNFRDDDKLRAKVASAGASIQKQLQGMLVDSELRQIELRD